MYQFGTFMCCNRTDTETAISTLITFHNYHFLVVRIIKLSFLSKFDYNTTLLSMFTMLCISSLGLTGGRVTL